MIQKVVNDLSVDATWGMHTLWEIVPSLASKDLVQRALRHPFQGENPINGSLSEFSSVVQSFPDQLAGKVREVREKLQSRSLKNVIYRQYLTDKQCCGNDVSHWQQRPRQEMEKAQSTAGAARWVLPEGSKPGAGLKSRVMRLKPGLEGRASCLALC